MIQAMKREWTKMEIPATRYDPGEGNDPDAKTTDEQALLRRRIKMQRRELRRLHRQIQYKNEMVARYRVETENQRLRNYKHAMQIVSGFMFTGRVVKALAKWI